MFTLKEKIVNTLSNVKILETAIDYAVSVKAPNCYTSNLETQLAVLNDVLELYYKQLPVVPSTALPAAVKEVIYSID